MSCLALRTSACACEPVEGGDLARGRRGIFSWWTASIVHFSVLFCCVAELYIPEQVLNASSWLRHFEVGFDILKLAARSHFLGEISNHFLPLFYSDRCSGRPI